ncbi:FG-GAP repeat domain-containing protein [Halosegnis sp.]|uniref:FG-GAP repeat domain-containing protein n=1 Tax=Halosegnis sp. TaxID=2864959 RepID=UPI0035D4EB7B
MSPASQPDGNRGVSEVVGFLVIVSLVTVLIGWYQATVVPSAIEESEFEHNERIQSELVTLAEQVPAAATADTRRSAVLHLGPRYDSPALFSAPQPPQGRLTTVGVSDPGVAVTITGANASAVAGADTADVWNGSTRTFNTGFIEYHPEYTRYATAPMTGYEHAVVYNRRPASGAVVALTGQQLITGQRISLVTLAGSYTATGRVERLPIVPRSAPVEVVPVRNATQPITLTVPTQLANSTWAQLLQSEYAHNGGHIVDQSYTSTASGPNELTLELEAGVTYQVALGQVSLGEATPDMPVASYIVSTRGDNRHVPAGSRRKLAVEVRDRFDNPVAGEPVSVSLSPDVGTVTFPAGNITASDGRVPLVYHAPEDAGATVNVTVSFADGSSPPERTNISLLVGDLGGPGPAYGSRVVFTQSDTIHTATTQGITTHQPSNAVALGPIRPKLDGDSDGDIPYVTSNSELKLVDTNDNTRVLVDSGVATSKTSLAVGKWQGSDRSVFYVNSSDNNHIYRASISGGSVSTTQVLDDKAEAIGGLGDVDGDNAAELVFSTSSSGVYYLDGDGSVTKTYSSLGRNNGNGIGEPADFDGDGTARIPAVSGSNEIVLITDSGLTTKLTSGVAAQSPIAAVDWDDDGTPEIVFVHTSGELRYVDNVAIGGTVKDIRGGSVSADKDAGTA